MVAAFYSPVPGRSGTSTNMLSLAYMLAVRHNKKILLLQSHFDAEPLEEFIIKIPRQIKENWLPDDYGMDNIVRSRKMADLDKDMIICSSYSFLEGKVLLLPGTRQENTQVWNDVVKKQLLEIMDMAEHIFDMVFVDVNSQKHGMYEDLLNRADIVAVNIPQNPHTLARFMLRNQVPEKKLFYIVGNYHKSSHYNMNNLRLLISGMNKKNSTYLEYNPLLRDMVIDSKSFHFIQHYISCGPKDKNYAYIRSVKKASARFLKKAGDCNA